jgi:hypothetical protein
LDVKAVAVDLKGRIRAADSYAATLTSPLLLDDDKWLRIASRLDVGPGTYQVRVGARRADTGVQGSVYLEVDIPAFDRDFAAGGLFLGTTETRDVGSAGVVTSVLPVIPVAAPRIPKRMAVALALPLRLGPRYRTQQVEFRLTLSDAAGRDRELARVKEPARRFATDEGSSFVYAFPPSAFASGTYRLSLDVEVPTLRPHRRSIAFDVE